eukprot:jgi/Mesvir1/15167/Mv04848-RA.1
MLDPPLQEVTLEQLMAVPGIGSQVMSLLPVPDRVRLRRTCRIFLAAVDESLSRLTELFAEDVTGRERMPVDTTDSLPWLMTKCRKLRALSLTSRADHARPWQVRKAALLWWPLSWPCRVACVGGGSLSLEGLIGRCQEVKYLNLAGCKDVTHATLVAVAGSCTGLEALDVSSCDVGDAGVQAVAEHCQGLRRLTMFDCSLVSDGTLRSLAQHAPQLEALEASGTSVTDEGITALAQGCKHLLRLVVPEGVTDVGITQVAARCPDLEQLGVHGTHRVTDVSLTSLAAGCPRMRHLEVARCEHVTDDGISALARRCAGLRHLNVAVTGVTDTGILAVARHCAGLGYLNVGKCAQVTDASMELLASKCAQLEHLSVEQCPLVTDAGICQVAQGCPGIWELTVSGCGVGDAGIRAIAGCCRKLRCLQMAQVGSVKGDTLAAVAQGCPKLEILDVTSSKCATKESLAALSLNCKSLRVVKAGGNDVGDEDIAPVIQERGHELRELDLSGTSVTDKTVALVAQSCPRLQGLRVNACCVTEEMGDLLAACCRELYYVYVQRVDGMSYRLIRG